jgi:hypothetical protein
MRKTIVLILVLLSFANIQAQNVGESYDKTKYRIEKINKTYYYFYKKNGGRYKNYGLLKNGKVVLPALFKKDRRSNETKLILSFKGLSGLYNLETNDWSIPLSYESIVPFTESTYKVKLNGKYGLVDVFNNIVVPFEWAYLGSFEAAENYCLVKDPISDKYGLYNLISKKMVISCEYDEIRRTNNPSHFKVLNEQKFNIVDINNVLLFKNWYSVLIIPKGGRRNFIVQLNNKMGIIDKNEKAIIPIEYKYISTDSYKDGSYLARNNKGYYGCLSLDGKITLPFKYSNVEKVGYGRANIIAKTDNKCGVVRINDGMPYEIATCNFDNVVSEGKAFVVEKDDKFGLIDNYGEKLTEIAFDNIKGVLNSGSSRSILFIAQKNKRYSVLNSFGKQISKKDYALITELYKADSDGYFSKDRQYLVVKGEGKYGLVDVFAKEIVPQIFDSIQYRREGFLIVIQGNKKGLYDIIKNEFVAPPEFDAIHTSKKGFIASKGNIFYTLKPGNVNIVQKMEFEY